MKKLAYIVLTVLMAGTAKAQNIQAYSADQLMNRITGKDTANDTLYIVNFWATWCGPCVGEIHEFDKLHSYYAGKPVKIILASLDQKSVYPKKLSKFVHKKGLLPEVVWFNETNATYFIPKIEPRWQGSLPATLINYEKGQYQNFYEGTITAEQIKLIVDKQLALTP
jgi:thiol-disulfide isomerase/thioredoxin